MLTPQLPSSLLTLYNMWLANQKRPKNYSEKSRSYPIPAKSPSRENFTMSTRNLKNSAKLTKQIWAQNMIWAAKTSKKHDQQKWIPFTSVSYRFRVMSTSLKWHHYEVVEVKLILFFQLSPWVSISFIIPMKISKIGGNLQNHFLVQECNVSFWKFRKHMTSKNGLHLIISPIDFKILPNL